MTKPPIRKDTTIDVKIQRALEDCAAGDHTMRGGVCADCGHDARPLVCMHLAKQFCQLCGERFCPNQGCDPDHREGCREANRP